MKHFGTTLTQTSSALMGPQLGSNNNDRDQISRSEAIARIVLTFLLVIIAVFLIIKTDILPGESTKDIGEILLGAITGYWLK